MNKKTPPQLRDDQKKFIEELISAKWKVDFRFDGESTSEIFNDAVNEARALIARTRFRLVKMKGKYYLENGGNLLDWATMHPIDPDTGHTLAETLRAADRSHLVILRAWESEFVVIAEKTPNPYNIDSERKRLGGMKSKRKLSREDAKEMVEKKIKKRREKLTPPKFPK